MEKDVDGKGCLTKIMFDVTKYQISTHWNIVRVNNVVRNVVVGSRNVVGNVVNNIHIVIIFSIYGNKYEY